MIAAPDVKPLQVVVMGVSGCGKSTVGKALARALDLPFIEGDELHPARNVALMAAGVPLTDVDRHGWLLSVAQQLGDQTAHARGVVVSCSALKRSYRDLLRSRAPGVRFVFLHGDEPLLRERMHTRPGHYMPPALLQSQLDTLEPPQADERAIAMDVSWPLARIVGEAQRELQSTSAAGCA